VTAEGREPFPDEAGSRLCVDAVTPGYFQSMGIELLEGRDFEDRDLKPDSRVSIVNETMARRFWPGESALGRRWIGGSTPPRDGRWNVVVGVVKDMRREGLDLAPIASAFVPDIFSRNFDLTVRVASNAGTVIPAVWREIRSIDSSVPIPEISTAEGLLSERLGVRRFEAQLLGGFAGVALLLSAAGLYASLAYQVALRTREIGIRSALGARRQAIVVMIVGKGVRLALAGAIVGVIGAVSFARLLQSLLYETAAISPATYCATTLCVLGVAAGAAWLPARRAAGVSPMTALRDD
jgi:hypothetical protein